MCKEHKMIEPFLDHQVSEGKISYGLSSMGYDVRISDEYRIFTNVNSSLVDPKNFSDENFIERKGPYCIIPPNSFVLAKIVLLFLSHLPHSEPNPFCCLLYKVELILLFVFAFFLILGDQHSMQIGSGEVGGGCDRFKMIGRIVGTFWDGF